MTHDPFDGEITTTEEFESALGHLVSTAGENGVDLNGSWVFRNGDVAPDWEVMVVELEKGDGTG